MPFLLSAVAFDRFAGAFRWLRDHYTAITVVSGAILIVVGGLFDLHEMQQLAGQIRSIMPSLGLGGLDNWVER